MRHRGEDRHVCAWLEGKPHFGEIDEFNAANPNCQIKYQQEDSQGDPAQAPAIAQKLVAQSDVIGVVGPAFSGETDASGPAYSEAGLVTVSPSATRVDLSTKGYWGMGIVLLMGSLVNLVKYRTDDRNARDVVRQLEQAKNEKILKDYVGNQ